MILYYIIVAVIGLVIGSFLNVIICRVPEKKSIVSPGSKCPNCNYELKFFDLIPVLSYILISGKCRKCKVNISPIYPIIELITALSYIVIFSEFGLSFEFFAFAFLISILIPVFVIDYRYYIIPNGLVITGLIGGGILFVVNIFQSFEYFGGGILAPIIGGLSSSLILLLISILGAAIYKTDDALGLGDVKIFVVIGMFLGWRMSLVALFISVMISGAFSSILLISGKKDKKGTIPLGPFIVIGTFITMLYGSKILNWYLSRYIYL